MLFDGETGALDGLSTSVNASVSADAARTGSGGLRISGTAAPAYARWGTDALTQGRAHGSARLWVRVLSGAPDESIDLLTIANSERSRNFDLFVTPGSGRFKWDLSSGDADESDFAVTYGQWYFIEVQVFYGGDTYTANVARGGAARFRVRVQNDGTATETFAVRGGRGARNWRVRYFAGRRDVTAPVKAGSYRITDLRPGRHRTLRVVIEPKRTARRGAERTVAVTARATRWPTARDTVKATARRR